MTGRWPLLLTVAALLLGACAPGPLAAPEPGVAATPTLPAASPRSASPDGRVVVAYPDEPSTFLGPQGAEVATDDLAALWGLPLLRLDPSGQVRRGLAADWEVLPADDGRPFRVRLALRPGEWTDGTTVDAADVVATLTARREQEPGRFAAITDVTAPSAATVEVAFDRTHAGWADLLVEAGTILPSEQALDAAGYVDGVPVSGGPFRLAERDAGLRLTFRAHPDGPLGAPGVERIDVLFTPSFETALGLLEEGEVQVLLGYLALNGVPRATDVDGVRAASPLGGTTVSLEARPGGALGGEDLADRRRGVAETIDVTELVEGLLGTNGEVATTPWPGVDLPAGRPVGEVREGQELVLLVPGGSEVLGFVARALQRDLVARGMTVDIVTEPAPRFAQVVGTERDLALRVRRTPPRPSLAAFVDDPTLASAAGADVADGPDARTALDAVATSARTVPLFRIGVLHAWRGVDGIRPSSWVGAGFWDAVSWTVAPVE